MALGFRPLGFIGLLLTLLMVPPAQADRLQLVKLADQALYTAKAEGRNCVRAAASADPRHHATDWQLTTSAAYNARFIASF